MGNKNKMLIIDDDQAFALILVNHFSDNYKVKVAHDGTDALELVESFQPDIILLDYFLPHTTGDKLFEHIHKSHPDIHVIVLSANESSKTVVELVKLGVREYVVKDDDAIAEVERILEEGFDD